MDIAAKQKIAFIYVCVYVYVCVRVSNFIYMEVHGLLLP